LSIYHQILGVKEDALLEEIKSHYRDLCKKYHPDVTNNESISKMALINEAYDFLARKKVQFESLETDGRENTENKTDNIVIYKDQAYAFYKQGIIAFDKVNKKIRHNEVPVYFSEKTKNRLSSFELLVLNALYYFNIIATRYPLSEWIDDSMEKITELNRMREIIKKKRNS